MVDKRRQRDEMVRHSVEKNGNKNEMGDISEIYVLGKGNVEVQLALMVLWRRHS